MEKRKVKYKTGSKNEFENDGIFHCWGLSMEDSGDQLASYSQAIIEIPDGSVIMIHPEWIKFID